MKKIYSVILLLAVMLSSCTKDETDIMTDDNSNAPALAKTRSDGSDMVEYELLPNPYTVDVIQGVYDSYNVSKTIEPTDLYVRFLPQDSLQLIALKNDYDLELFDYPLNIELPEDAVYQDPTIPEGSFTWLYTTVKPDFAFPKEIPYEVIEECYIPAEDETAVNGEWVKGPGIEFFEAMKEQLGDKKVIAENLGFLTDSVHKLLDDTGFPGMNVLEFAFGAYDDSIYLPHKYKENSVVYTGTHDNDTVVGWYETLSEDDKKFLEHYLKYSTIERTGTVHLDLISLALESRSDMVIIPLQDYLGLGNEARINTPSTVGGNWEWRVKEEQLTDELKELIRTLTIKYRTVAEENAKKAAEEAQQ